MFINCWWCKSRIRTKMNTWYSPNCIQDIPPFNGLEDEEELKDCDLFNIPRYQKVVNTELSVMVGVLAYAWKMGLNILYVMTCLCSMSTWNQFSFKSIKIQKSTLMRHDSGITFTFRCSEKKLVKSILDTKVPLFGMVSWKVALKLMKVNMFLLNIWDIWFWMVRCDIYVFYYLCWCEMRICISICACIFTCQCIWIGVQIYLCVINLFPCMCIFL